MTAPVSTEPAFGATGKEWRNLLNVANYPKELLIIIRLPRLENSIPVLSWANAERFFKPSREMAPIRQPDSRTNLLNTQIRSLQQIPSSFNSIAPDVLDWC